MKTKNNNFGYIEVICGPMFSGKTKELIRRIEKLKNNNKTINVFKPKADNRYSSNSIVAHNGQKIDCISISNTNQINDYIKNTDVFAFDEMQFFDISIVEICNKLANLNKRVIIAGLDKDYDAKPFGPMPYILTYAENITKLNAVCKQCGNNANFSYRIVRNKSQILVGESEKYEPRCRECYNLKRRK